MSESFTKVLPNGQSFTYKPLGGNLPRFMFIHKDAKGHLIEMGEVYNSVLTEKNVNDFNPREFDKKDGRWMTFYPYQDGQKPFDFVASTSTYRADFEVGSYRRFYSPNEKPYARNLSKESGNLGGLYHAYTSKPFDEITYIDMQGKKHKCLWKAGKPFSGEILYGYGTGKVWRESILTYQKGQLHPKTIRSIYTRQKLQEAYRLYARQG